MVKLLSLVITKRPIDVLDLLKRERGKKGTLGAKTSLPSVTAFFVFVFLFVCFFANENAPKWTSQNDFWKSLPMIGFKMWYRFDVSWNIVLFIVQSGLKLYDFTIVAARVETNRKPSGSRFRGRERNVVNNNESNNWATSTAGKTMLFCVGYSRKKMSSFLDVSAYLACFW